MLTSERRKARSRLACETARANRDGSNPQVDQGVEDARRDYYAVALEDHIRQVVDRAPSLTADQRSRLARLLRGGGPDA